MIRVASSTRAGAALALIASLALNGCDDSRPTAQQSVRGTSSTGSERRMEEGEKRGGRYETQSLKVPRPSLEELDVMELLRRAIKQLLHDQQIDVDITNDRIIPGGGGSVPVEGRELTYLIVEPLYVMPQRVVVQGAIHLIDDTDPGESVWTLATFRRGDPVRFSPLSSSN
jgi:hypothetical protein